MDSFIDFVLVLEVEGIHFSPERPNGIEFKTPEDKGLRFSLSPTHPDKDASGHRQGLTCKVYKSYPATKDQVLFVESFNNIPKTMVRMAEGVSLPYKSKNETLIDIDGTCLKGYSPRRHMCPSDITNLVNEAEAYLSAQASRFLKLLRWHQNFDSPGEVLKHHSLYWRVETGDYPHAPLEGTSSQPKTIQGMFGIHWSEEHSKDLQKLWISNDTSEPLGHTLLREAASLSSESPRSAILMMTAALETAIKTHISKIAPDTAWLMEESPSPPVFKILKNYLPLIHSDRGNNLDFWGVLKPTLNKVQDLIEIRNKVAHTGIIPNGFGSIQDALTLVSDLLYLIDVLDGHEWAKSLISSTLRNKLGWPAPKDDRITITIEEGF